MARLHFNSLTAFASAISRLALNVQDFENRMVRKASLEIHKEVVLGTPVDTGRARSNWVVTLGGPWPSVIAPYAPGSRLGIGETANAQVAIAQGATVIGVRGKYVPVFITNNTPYIGALNEGFSGQAPPGFVDVGIAAGLSAAGNTVRFQYI